MKKKYEFRIERAMWYSTQMLRKEDLDREKLLGERGLNAM